MFFCAPILQWLSLHTSQSLMFSFSNCFFFFFTSFYSNWLSLFPPLTSLRIKRAVRYALIILHNHIHSLTCCAAAFTHLTAIAVLPSVVWWPKGVLQELTSMCLYIKLYTTNTRASIFLFFSIYFVSWPVCVVNVGN